MDIRTRRLTAFDCQAATALFAMMAEVFEEPSEKLNDAYLGRILARVDFWAFAAFVGDEIVGGLTAHTLPMTRGEYSEIFIYDIAVRKEQQRNPREDDTQQLTILVVNRCRTLRRGRSATARC